MFQRIALLTIELMQGDAKHYLRILAFQKQAGYLCIYNVCQI